MQTITELANRITAALSGEPARFIFYGAAIVIWAVVAISNALGFNQFGPNISLTDSLTQATLAGALITELIRRSVYSPNTVNTVAVDAYVRGVADGARDVPVALPPTGDLPDVDLDA